MTERRDRRESIAERRDRRESIAERRERRAAVDDPQLVLDAGLRFLEARPRSVAEVRRRLGQAGYRSELVEGAIGRLVDLGMLDDEAFARTWLESRDRARPRGEHALRQELRLKGIDAPTAEAALAARREKAGGDGAGDADESAAEHLLRRRARSLERLEDPRLRRERAYALLARHGFDPAVARDVARRFVASLEADGTDDTP